MRTALLAGSTVGAASGLAIAYVLFTHVSWYHDFIAWQFQHPLMIAPAIAVGALIGWLTD